MQLTSIKLLIMDESPSFCNALRKAAGEDKSIRVVGAAGSAGEAIRIIREQEPDILVADPDMPDLTAVLTSISGSSVPPLIAVGTRRPAAGLPGLCDFVQKPKSGSADDFNAFCNELCVKIKISYRPRPVGRERAPRPERRDVRYHLIAIGASTGGTEATAEILKDLPGGLPGILIVQHMPAGFTEMYAERLDRMCPFRVYEARDGSRVRTGTALVAPGGKQMVLKKDRDGYFVQCREGPKVNGHCPSVGVLFESVSKSAGPDAIGIILTGMGRDGAEGLLKMRAAGAYTVGQDRASSVVYGMPMAAKEIGAVEEQASLENIAGIIVGRVHG